MLFIVCFIDNLASKKALKLLQHKFNNWKAMKVNEMANQILDFE